MHQKRIDIKTPSNLDTHIPSIKRGTGIEGWMPYASLAFS